jgi:hypothetical protein
MSIFNAIKFFRILTTAFVIFAVLCHEGNSMWWKWRHQQQAAEQAAAAKAAADKAAAEKAAAEQAEAEQRARDKAIAERIAFERDRAQKQLTQRQEHERKGVAWEQQQVQARLQGGGQFVPQIPQSQAQQESAHREGGVFAASLMGDAANAAKSTDPRIVPGFQTDRPQQAALNIGSIGDAALAEAKRNDVSQHLASQAQRRQNFKIDPNTDPLFIQANQTIKDPQKSLNEEFKEFSGGDAFGAAAAHEEIRTCEEGGDEYPQSCSKKLHIVLKITPATTRSAPHCPGHKERRGWSLHYSHWTCGGCTTTQVYVPKVVEVVSEEWISGCAVLEHLVEDGLCRYVNATRSVQDETRVIQGEPVKRDHFEELYEFACFKASPKSCAGLREQGCYQIRSTCKETVHGHCVLWEQTFACPSRTIPGASYHPSSKDSPFCLTGNCVDTSYEANNELLGVMSHLYALREAQNDLKNFKIIFKGESRACTRNLWNFRDCCGSGTGWGTTLHLSSCDAAEIELRTLRDKRLCVQVGTYCAEKHLGQCTRKKTTFCCYGTKMARLIQENGRAQLGIGFGNPESPDCSGFSSEQLSRINFSRINFSEIFEDIRNQTVVKDQRQSLAQVSAERLQNNMSLLTKPPANAKSAADREELKERGL